MADQLQLRGGSTLEHSTFVGVSREVTVDTSKNVAVVHDGITPGGHPLAKGSEVQAIWDNATDQSAINTLVKRDINGNFQTNEITANKFIGALQGNAATVTGGVYLTGNQTIEGTKTFSNTINGSISGNAATVTNGVYTTGDQTIGGTKTFSSTIQGSISGNAATATTANTASSVTNGVYTVSDQTIGGTKTFSNTINGSISGNAATVTNGVYTTGNQTIGGTKTFSSTIQGSISGNAATATKLATARTINGVNFDGTGNITVRPPAATNTLYGGVKVSLSGTTLTITV